jgi:hypothetical protein
MFLPRTAWNCTALHCTASSTTIVVQTSGWVSLPASFSPNVCTAHLAKMLLLGVTRELHCIFAACNHEQVYNTALIHMYPSVNWNFWQMLMRLLFLKEGLNSKAGCIELGKPWCPPPFNAQDFYSSTQDDMYEYTECSRIWWK